MKSGNDAATALAITTAGSQKAFVARMNAKAASSALHARASRTRTDWTSRDTIRPLATSKSSLGTRWRTRSSGGS